MRPFLWSEIWNSKRNRKLPHISLWCLFMWFKCKQLTLSHQKFKWYVQTHVLKTHFSKWKTIFRPYSCLGFLYPSQKWTVIIICTQCYQHVIVFAHNFNFLDRINECYFLVSAFSKIESHALSSHPLSFPKHTHSPLHNPLRNSPGSTKIETE